MLRERWVLKVAGSASKSSTAVRDAMPAPPTNGSGAGRDDARDHAMSTNSSSRATPLAVHAAGFVPAGSSSSRVTGTCRGGKTGRAGPAFDVWRTCPSSLRGPD